MAKVLITSRSVAENKEGKAILEAAGHEIITHIGDGVWPEAEMVRIIPGMDAIIAGLDEITGKVIEAGAPSLKIIARNGVGYNKVDVKTAETMGIPVTLAPGSNTISVCELVFGLLLSLTRSIPVQDSEVRHGGWKRNMGYELYGKVLGVLGTGNIGSEVIKRAHAFGMDIIAFDVWQRSELCDKYNVKYLPLEEVLKQSDVLTLHLPVTPDTKNMINKHTLATMKNTTFIVNTARGELVDEQDLCTALKDGTLAGYCTDTLAQEPPASDHPFFALPNVIVTPHSGAYTREAVIRCSVTAAQEVVRVLSGQAPLYAVPKKM
ncbi:MAG: Phosphoglycerate dehydrogenase [Firmicutes bacterium]|nr:Phosphoglycerate dehydrogenase [Bacillota bacterium]